MFLGSIEFTNCITSLLEDTNNLQLLSFNFTLFNELCANRSLVLSINEDWLLWFLGFSERRGHFIMYFRRKSFTFSSTSRDILVLIKSGLNLQGSIIQTSRGQYVLNIISYYDWEILACLMYPNIVTSSLINGFQEYFNSGNGELFPVLPVVKYSLISLNNAWLSGYIDANISFYFTKNTSSRFTAHVVISFGDMEVMGIVITLFKQCRLLPPKKEHGDRNRIKFKGYAAAMEVFEYLEKYPLKYKLPLQIWMKECLDIQKSVLDSTKPGSAYTAAQKQMIADKVSSRPNLD